MEKSLCEKLTNCFDNNRNTFEPFIRKLVFHNFKNLASFQELTLDFPVTVLIGKNGTNKSSALLALYAIRQNTNLRDYWFGTPIDSLSRKDGNPRYFYTYQDPDTKQIAEVLQINNQSKNDPDYWEPSRPIVKDGMRPFSIMPKSSLKTKTRWSKIDKPVLYINFKAHISAFDKYFYHSQKISQLSSKKKVILQGAKRLSNAIKENKLEDIYYKQDKIINKINYELSEEEINIISSILGKSYSSIHYIEHRYFDGVEGGTAILKSHDLTYSEAFAGSGEYSIVSLIYKIMRCQEKSLILLDEPEVSIHPSAQLKLMNFMFNQALKKKHQIVISTHSPTLIKNLPKRAIKLFIENKLTQKVEIFSDIHHSYAFNEIGIETEKIPIYVEDKLSQEIINRIINQDKNLESKFSCQIYTGGASVIVSRATSVLAATKKRCLIFLDGDQKTEAYMGNKNRFEICESNDPERYAKLIKEYYGPVSINPSGKDTSNKNEKLQLMSDLWTFISNNVFYFDFDHPEKFIVEQLANDESVNIPDLENETEKEYFKNRIKEYTIRETGDENVTGDDIFTMSKTLIKKVFDKSSPELENIRQILNNYEK